MKHIPPPSTLTAGSIVWAYLRDSGGDGQEQSVPQQLAEVKAFCAEHGLILARVFIDVAKSAGSVVGREHFVEMIDLTADAHLCPAGVILWNFARFARDLDDSTYYKATLRKRGIVVHSLTDPIPEGEWGRVAEVFIDVANEEKRRQTSRDVKRALKTLVQQGYASGGVPPRGYKAVKEVIGYKRDGQPRTVSRWEPDPELWDVCKLAWQMRAEGKPYEAIQEATGRRIYKSRNCWVTFFRNESYLGIGKAGNDRVPNHHPAMIDQATWEAVQKVNHAQDHARFVDGDLNAPRRLGTPSLLSGLGRCTHCGSAMCYGVAKSGRQHEAEWPYYICGKKNRQGAAACPSRRLGAQAADQAVLKAVFTRVLSSDFTTNLLEGVSEHFDDTTALVVKLECQQRALKTCNRAIANLLDTVEQFGAEAAGTKLKQREGERHTILAEIATLESQLAAANIAITPEALQAMFEVWLAGVKARDDVRAQKVFLTRFVSQVELGYNLIRIHYNFQL